MRIHTKSKLLDLSQHVNVQCTLHLPVGTAPGMKLVFYGILVLVNAITTGKIHTRSILLDFSNYVHTWHSTMHLSFVEPHNQYEYMAYTRID